MYPAESNRYRSEMTKHNVVYVFANFSYSWKETGEGNFYDRYILLIFYYRIDDSNNNPGRLLAEAEGKDYKLENVAKCEIPARSGKFNVSISTPAHLYSQL